MLTSRRSLPSHRLWLLIPAACLVPAILDAVQAYAQGRIGGGEPSWRYVIFQGTEWLFLGALTPIAYLLGRRFPLRQPRLTRNLVVHLGGALALCVAWASLGVALRLALGSAPDDQSLGQHLASWMLTSLPWSVFMYFTVLGCVYAFTYYVEARERETQASRLSAQLAEARLGALRMQLNPHFLFNSLNAITVLVRDQDTRSATRMLELLGEMLRQVLRTDQAHEVTLAEELGFLERYLAIERVRFSDRLRPTLAVDERLLDAAVPPFVLQPLVENALRHGLARRTDAGSLEIGAREDRDELVLWVRDDGPGLDEGGEGGAPRGEGVGLTNTRERLATLYGDRARLELAEAPGGGAVASVRLPLRRVGDRGGVRLPAAPPGAAPERSAHA